MSHQQNEDNRDEFAKVIRGWRPEGDTVSVGNRARVRVLIADLRAAEAELALARNVLKSAEVAATLARGAFGKCQAEIAAAHKMQPGDSFDLHTGIVVRAATKES